MSLQSHPVPEARTINIGCPKCGSAEARRLSLIYQEGLSIINTSSSTVGSGFGGGGAAFGSASTHTTGRQQTALSKQAAPPAKKHTILWSMAAAVFGIGALGNLSSPGLGTLIAIGIAAVAVRFALQAKKYNADVHPGLHQRWTQSFMCNRCGEVFAV